MIIDFHTHAFSEKIVEKAMSKLTATKGVERLYRTEHQTDFLK